MRNAHCKLNKQKSSRELCDARRGKVKMIDLRSLKNAPSKARKNYLRPGTYHSEVLYADWSDAYVAKAAFEIKYRLTDAAGAEFTYGEVFFAKGNNRTDEFLDYLLANGLEEISEFVGCTEELVLKKDVRDNKARLRITERKLLGYPTDVGVQN